MKNKIRTYCSIMLVFYLFGSTVLFSKAQDLVACKQELKQLFKINEERKNDTISIIRFTYEVETVYRFNSIGMKKMTIDYYKEPGYSSFTSDSYSSYSDKKDCFIIQPENKLIYRADPRIAQLSTSKLSDMLAIQMIDSSTIVSCTILESGEKRVEVKMKPSTTSIDKIVYIYNPSTWIMSSTKVIYTSNYELVETSYRVYNYSSSLVATSASPKLASEMVFQSGTVLKEKYKHFTLVDLKK